MLNNMETVICNKCYAGVINGKKPYMLTQCGHVYCQLCTQLAKKQCPRCNMKNIVSMPIQEPMSPKISHYFQPMSGMLEKLQKIESFQNKQIKIVLQRFYEVEKKYDILKRQYSNAVKNIKVLTDKYYRMKAESEKLQKKLMFVEMSNVALNTPSRTSTSSHVPTSMNSASQRVIRCSPYVHFSDCQSREGCLITPQQPHSMSKYRQTSEEFRIPFRAPPRSVRSNATSYNSSY